MERQSLKIAICCVGFPILSETFILNQIVGFLQMGYTVDVFPYYANFSAKFHKDVEKYHLQKRVFPAILPSKNKLIRIVVGAFYAIKYLRYLPLLVRTLDIKKFGKEALNLKVFYSALQFLRPHQYDLFIAHFGENGVGLAQLKEAGIITCPLLTYFHGYDLHFQEASISQRKSFYRNLFLQGHSFVTNSFYSYQLLLQLGAPANRTITIPVGLDLHKLLSLKKEKSEKIITILSIGRLIQFKGHSFGIKSIKRLIDKDFNFIRYFIIGEGELRKDLHDEIEGLGLKNIVTLTGSLTQEQIYQYLAQADLFLHPSIKDNMGREENQGLVIQEAQAAGLPIIAFDSGGVSDGVPVSTGILVTEKDVAALATALETLINSPKERKDMGEMGRKWVREHYNIKDLNKRLLQTVGLA